MYKTQDVCQKRSSGGFWEESKMTLGHLVGDDGWSWLKLAVFFYKNLCNQDIDS